MTIGDYCLKQVKELEIDQQLKSEQARQIYENLIKAVQCVNMNLGVARNGSAQQKTEKARHNRAVEKALSMVSSEMPIEISFKVEGQKSVTLKSQIRKDGNAFIIFQPAELKPLLLSLVKDNAETSPRRLSRQTEAIKCFITVAERLTSIGMSKNAASKFIEDILIEMGWEKISLQQIYANLFP